MEVSDIVVRLLELLNGGLGFGKFQVIAALFVLSIILFSIKELYEYGPFEFAVNPVIAELLETSFLFLITMAAFILVGLRK